MRKDARNSQDKTFTSARNLLGVLRLATALARLRLSDAVEKDDVKEANRLIEASKHSVNYSEMSGGLPKPNQIKSKMYALIRDLASADNVIKVADIMDRCASKGYTPAQVNEVIDEYEELNLWQVNQARTKLTLV